MTLIIQSPSIPLATVLENAAKANCTSWFYRATIALWDVCTEQVPVDPAVAIAQCAFETGWGRFGGAMTPQHGNTCGLKNVDATGDTAADLAHFAISRDGYPLVGALAHAHHLMLYAGLEVDDNTPDPRAWLIRDSSRWGKAKNVEDLGGLWAPSADYGTRIVNNWNLLGRR